MQRIARWLGILVPAVAPPFLAAALEPPGASYTTEVAYIVGHLPHVAHELASPGTPISVALPIVEAAAASVILLVWIYWLLGIVVGLVAMLRPNRDKPRSSRLFASAAMILALWQASGVLATRSAGPMPATGQVQLAASHTAAPRPRHTVTVTPGADLWGIAAQLLGPGASNTDVANLVDQIAQLNGLEDPNLVYPGQVLVVPTSSTSTNATVPVVTLRPTSAPSSDPTTLEAPPLPTKPSVPETAFTLELRTPSPQRGPVAVPWGAIGALGTALLGAGAWFQRRRQRTHGHVVELGEDAEAWVSLGVEAARHLFNHTEAALAALAASGAPRLELLEVAEDGTVRVELAEPATLTEPWHPAGERAWSAKLHGAVVDPLALAATYGGVRLVGFDRERSVWVFVDCARGVRTIDGAGAEFWRAMAAQALWAPWAEGAVGLATEALELPVTTLSRDELLDVVEEQIAALDDARRRSGRLEARQARLAAGLVPLVIVAPVLDDVTREHLHARIGQEDVIGVLTSGAGGWVVHEGTLHLDTPSGRRSLEPISLASSEALRTAALSAALERAELVELSRAGIERLLTSRRSGSLIVEITHELGVLRVDGAALELSATAVRVATALALCVDTLDERTLAVATGLVKSQVAAALDELERAAPGHWGAPGARRAAHVALDLSVAVRPDGGVDLARLEALTGSRPFFGELAALPLGLRRARDLEAWLVDRVVDDAMAGRVELARAAAVLRAAVGEDAEVLLLELRATLRERGPEALADVLEGPLADPTDAVAARLRDVVEEELTRKEER